MFKKAVLVLIGAFAWCVPLHAGSVCKKIWQAQVGTTCPASCTPYEVCIDSDDETFNACLTTDNWTAIGGAQDVASVFGRTGAVVATAGDYTCSQVTGCPDSVQAYGSLEKHEPLGDGFGLTTSLVEYDEWENSADLVNMSATVGVGVDTLDTDEAGDYWVHVDVSSSGSTNDKVNHGIFKNGAVITEQGGDTDDRCFTGRQPSTGGALGSVSWGCTITLAVNDTLSVAFSAAVGTPTYTIFHIRMTAVRITDSGGGNIICVEDGEDLGTFSCVDTTGNLSDSPQVNFSLADGGAGGPDAITASIRANSIALGPDTVNNYAAGDAEAGAALTGDSASAFFPVGQLELERQEHQVVTLSRGTAVNILNATDATIDWDVEDEDPLGLHEGVTNPSRITFTETGRWECRTSLRLETTTGTGPACSTFLFNAGTLTPSSGRVCVAGTGVATRGPNPGHATFSFAVLANDFIEVRIRNQTGATADLGAGSWVSCSRQQ